MYVFTTKPVNIFITLHRNDFPFYVDNTQDLLLANFKHNIVKYSH